MKKIKIADIADYYDRFGDFALRCGAGICTFANRQGEGDVFIFQPDAVWVCKFCTVYNCNAHLRSFIACVDFN